MTVQNATCPPESMLSDFGLGKLDAASADSISRHIETCPDCRQRVASLSGDSFVGRLREAGGAAQPAPKRERTYVPGESLANAANSTDGSSASNVGQPSSVVGREHGLPRPSRSSDDVTRRDGLGSPSSAPPELANHPDYELIKELGQGGMGTVYLAKNRMMGRLEVLKVISQALLNKPGVRERFLREIQSAASLHHANIVAAYSVFRLGDSLVFAMEYVKGQDLEKVVNGRGCLPVANAAFYVHQVAQGLQHAHEKGMVHRDIKPNNLMLAIEGKKHVVKILDFGLAKATSEKDTGTGLTKSGQMLGTPLFASPEQISDAHSADIRADIYSLGCTLYYLLSGNPPFQDQSLFDLLKAHHEREATPLNLVRAEVPVELAAVVSKMMAKDPAKRFQTPVEVAKALVPFFRPGQSVAIPPPGDGAQPQPASETAHALSTATVAPTTAPQPIPVAAPLAPLAPILPVAVSTPADLLSVSIDTRRPAPKHRAEWWPRLPPWQRWALAVMPAALLLIPGIVLLVRTPRGTVEIALSDPKANVEVTVDGDRVDISGLDEPLSLEVGEHEYTVRGTGFETRTKRFQVTRGKNAPVTITLVPTPQPAEVAPKTAVSEAGRSKRFPFEIPDPRLGRWSLDGDELVQSSLDQEMFMMLGDAGWNDFDFAAEVQRIEGNGLCGVWFRYQDYLNRNGYGVGIWNNTTHDLFSLDNGAITRQGSSKGSLTTGKWHHIELRVRGSHEQCFLDGEQVMAADSDRQSPGRLALVTWASPFRFRNIVVKAPDGNVLLDGLPDLDAEPPVKAYERDALNVLAARGGALPTGLGGRALNFDFETGDLQDWTAEGHAFKDQPNKGDTLHLHYKYLRSHHRGQFWIGGDEKSRDSATGTLTSAPFKVTHRYASFLLGGDGPWTDCCVELLQRDSGKPFFRAVGHHVETLHPVTVDLTEHLGQEVFIRVSDRSDRQHVNFDDFRFHDSKPGFTPAYARAAGVQAGTASDLLKRIDIDRDALVGVWEWDERKRLLASFGHRMLKLPADVPNEYDLAFTLEGVPGVDDVHLLLPVSGRQVLLVIDGWGKSISGLSLVDGKWANDNETTHRGAVLQEGQPNKLVCQVRRTSVTLTCNGATIVDWHGDPNRLSFEFGKVAGWDGLCIGGFHAPVYVSQLEITPITPPPAGEEPARAIAPFDAKQARGHQKTWANHLGVPIEQTNSIGMKLTLIPPGEFTMGATQAEIDLACSTDADWWQQQFRSESPQHRVTLTPCIYLGSCEVTQEQYQRVTGTNPSHFSAAGAGKDAVQGSDTAQHPVENVNWFEDVDFCNRLSEAEQLPPYYARDAETVTILGGSGYRLPTEAEWEYACRAGTTTRWSVGDSEGELAKQAWYLYHTTSRYTTSRVGELPANAFGLHDMHGNVWELCWDRHGAYPDGAISDPTGVTEGRARVQRGGGFGQGAFRCRSALRIPTSPAGRENMRGFRVARTIGGGGEVPSEKTTGSRDEGKDASVISHGAEFDEPTTEKQTADKRSDSRRPAKPIDLLKQLVVGRPGTVGEWRMDKGRLVFPQIEDPSIAIFDPAPEEYILSAVVQCPSHAGGLGFGIVVGESQALVAIDSQGKTGSALGCIDGRLGKDNGTWNPVASSIIDGKPNVIEVKVRKNEVQVTCNGRRIINWLGDPSRLSLPALYAGRHSPSALFVSMAKSSPFIVPKLTLRELGATDGNRAAEKTAR